MHPKKDLDLFFFFFSFCRLNISKLNRVENSDDFDVKLNNRIAEDLKLVLKNIQQEFQNNLQIQFELNPQIEDVKEVIVKNEIQLEICQDQMRENDKFFENYDLELRTKKRNLSDSEKSLSELKSELAIQERTKLYIDEALKTEKIVQVRIDLPFQKGGSSWQHEGIIPCESQV